MRLSGTRIITLVDGLTQKTVEFVNQNSVSYWLPIEIESKIQRIVVGALKVEQFDVCE